MSFSSGPQSASRSCLLRRRGAAGAAEPAQLDDLPIDLEAERAAMPPQRLRDRVVVQLLRRSAIRADDELAVMRMIDIGAAGESVEALDAMDELLLEQEIDRPIDGGRRALVVELRQQRIGADRLSRLQDQLEHPPAQPRQADATALARVFRLGQRAGQLPSVHGFAPDPEVKFHSMRFPP